MKKILISSLISLLFLSCSVSAPDNSSPSPFTLHSSPDFTDLEKEYRRFSTKALSNAYVSRMFNRFLNTSSNPTQVIRQLEFARYLKDVKSDPSYFNSLKNIIATDNSIFTKIDTTTGVPAKKTTESATFGVFVDSLNPLQAPGTTSTTNITASGFTANWAAVSGATYDLVVTKVSDSSIVFDQNIGSLITYPVTGLSATTAYTWKVRTNKSSLNSPYTSNQSVTTDSVNLTSLLDIYPGASVAYSLRKLRNTYNGSAVRIRRSSDNAEQDIGFVSGVLDTSSLLSFVGSGNGFVTKWYDQSGNNNNATQSTESEQPKIVSSGTTQTLDGLPVIDFTSQRLTFTNLNNDTTDIFTVLNVISTSTWGGYIRTGAVNEKGFAVNSQGGWQSLFYQTSNGNEYQVNLTSRARNSVKSLPTGQYLENWHCNGVTFPTFFENNSSVSVVTPVTIWHTLTTPYIGSLSYNGPVSGHNQIQEMIIYTSSQSSNRTAIGDNISAFYTL